MADLGLLEGKCAAFKGEEKTALLGIVRELCRNITFGSADASGDERKATNFRLYAVEGRTPAVADTLFSIEHGLGAVPRLMMPVIPLNVVGMQFVPLEVAAQPDHRRIYLKSTAEDAPFTVWVEG